MEHFTRANPGLMRDSKTSSVYSQDSTKGPRYSDYAESLESISSRPTSSTPSYMNAAPPRKPVLTPAIRTSGLDGTSGRTQPVETYSPADHVTAIVPAPVPKGLLLLVIAALPHPLTISHLEVMLKKSSYSGICIIGGAEHEAGLKQLKMSLYALLGKMSQEVAVQMDLRQSWGEDEISEAIRKATKNGDAVNGVLCSPAYEANQNLGLDILALGNNQLELPWKFSVGFLQHVAKYTVPKLVANNHMQHGPAFLVTGLIGRSPTSTVYKAACNALVNILAETYSPNGLIVAYAEDVLIPEPEPAKHNGTGLHLSAKAGPVDAELEGLTPESPTKLWNMWALQDELGAVN